MRSKLFLLLCLPFFVWSQIPPGYYNSAIGLTGNNLRVALYNIISNHTIIAYGGLWSAFPKTDAKSNGKVWDIYSYNPSGPQPYEFTFVTNQCGNYSAESDCYNREHSWPQSWFNATAGPDSDLFHIYPTDGYVNNKRGNYPYGNVGTASYVSMNGGKLGTCTNPGYSLTVFEPINEFKGDVARGYFYMSTRYKGEDAGWGTSDATNKATILPWQLNVLLQWHHQDPVSAKEIARNDSIYYKYQHNRNPFIDHPEWADSIWATSTMVQEIMNDISAGIMVKPNPTNGKCVVSIEMDRKENLHYKVLSITGELIEENKIAYANEIQLDVSKFSAGIYYIELISGNNFGHAKFIKN